MENPNENLIKLVKNTNEKLDRLFETVKTINNNAALDEQWMETFEVCESLRISKRTLQKHVKAGIFKMTRIGGMRYFKKSDILEFMEENHKYYRDDEK